MFLKCLKFACIQDYFRIILLNCQCRIDRKPATRHSVEPVTGLSTSSPHRVTVHRTVTYYFSSQPIAYKKNQPKWVGSFYGASDLTRTGDLLITSGDFAVFSCFEMCENVLQRNDFSDSALRIVLATGKLFL